MELDRLALTITEADLQGRDQVWIKLAGGNHIHLTLHKHNFRIVAWVGQSWSKLVKKMYRYRCEG